MARECMARKGIIRKFIVKHDNAWKIMARQDKAWYVKAIHVM
jgi:hypothetical protein